MEKIEATWSTSLPVWWSFFWRATLFGMLAGALFGAIGGFIVGVIGKPELGGIVGGIAGYIAAIPVSMWCMKKILGKSFSGYSVCLIKEDTI